MLETLKDILGAEGYNVVTVDSLEAARKNISQKFFHLVLVDLKLPEGSGLDLLRGGQESQPGYDGDNIYRLCLFRNRDYRPARRGIWLSA